MSRKIPAWTHQIAPSLSLYFSSPQAKCAATRGEAVQSRHLVGRPLCCATASTYHSECWSNEPALAYFLTLRRREGSTTFGRLVFNRSKLVAKGQSATSIPRKTYGER